MKTSEFAFQFIAEITGIDKKSLDSAKSLMSDSIGKLKLSLEKGSLNNTKQELKALATMMQQTQAGIRRSLNMGDTKSANVLMQQFTEMSNKLADFQTRLSESGRQWSRFVSKDTRAAFSRINIKGSLEQFQKAIDLIDGVDESSTKGSVGVSALAGAFNGLTKDSKLLNSVLDSEITKLSSASLAFHAAGIAVEFMKDTMAEMVKTATNLNKSMTDLQMVTLETGSSIYDTFDEYADMALELGVTTENVVNGANEWLRQGRSIEETNELIRASTIQATIAGMDYETSAKMLTATLNGYKKEASEAMDVVDALSAVDMAAATSVEELSSAMQRTANSARLAGVDFNNLIAYIAAVIDTSQQAPEVVGTAFKTMFARMSNVKAGASIDETGEALNDVEKVLNNYGISLRDSIGTFRDFDDVLVDVQKKWIELGEANNTVAQGQIATALGMSRQQEIFKVLMENWDKVNKYAKVAAESQGSAMEKYDVYLDSIEAKQKKIQAANEEFSYRQTIVEQQKAILDLQLALVELRDTLGPIFDSIAALMTALAKFATSIVNTINGVIDGIGDGIAELLGYDSRTNSEIADESTLYEQQIKYLEAKGELTKQEIANLEELNRLLKENNEELAKREEVANRPDLEGYSFTTAGYQYKQIQSQKYADYLAGNITAEDLEEFGGMAETSEVFKTLVEQGRELEGLDLSYLSADLQANAEACAEFAAANGELYDSLYAVDEAAEEAGSSIDNLTRAQYQYVDLDTALQRIDNEYDKVSAAIQEFDSQGYISANTASTLINVNKDYADAITLVNGRLVINREQVLALTEAERQNQIEMAKAAQANIENSIRETETTLKNIQTQIEAYKNLAASRKLATWEENVYGSYYESQRRLEQELADLEAQYDELGTEISILEAKNYDLAVSNTAVANTASDIEDSYRWFIGKVTDILDDEIDALQDEKDYWEDYYDDKIDAINDMIDALDQQEEEENKLLEIEEARAKLAQANQQVVRIYRRGQGMVELCHG